VHCGTVGGDKVHCGTVGGDKVHCGTVGGDKVHSGTVGGDKVHSGTVGGDKVKIKEMKNIEEMRKTLRDQLQISIETAVQVMLVTLSSLFCLLRSS